MRQSRLMSLVEATANVVVGYGVAVLTQLLVFPIFGIETSLSENLALGAIFSLVSSVRGYLLRRLFVTFSPVSGPLRAGIFRP
jgi:hypothetical protein